MRSSTCSRTSWRRAVILMVVLTMLALFAIVGLTAVLYAQNSARASSNFAKAWMYGFNGSTPSGGAGGVGGAGGAIGGVAGVGGAFGVGGVNGAGGGGPYVPPNVPPPDLFRWAYGQLIYDVNDYDGAQSAIRGHSLARTMYGFNDASLNIQPFNGLGRVSFTYSSTTFNGMDDRNLINYKYFPGFDLRDPGRLGTRSDVTTGNPVVPAWNTPTGEYVGGSNPPVTYPNLDNLALAAARADGTNLIPSLHRPWLFGSLDASNPNWTNAEGRYRLLRNRTADNLVTYPSDGRPGFPMPADATGDVKNKLGYPGGNDSVWIDLNYPIQRADDGRRFKPLFAFRVEDLDGRVNANTSGNLMGGVAPNQTHASNGGWGKWEINLARILNRADSPEAIAEWRNLFLGNPNVPNIASRYGRDGVPFAAKSSASGGKFTRFFGQVDYNGSDETNNFGPTGLMQLLATSPFPAFSSGYDNGQQVARQSHAKLFDYFRPDFVGPANQYPYTYDAVFPASDIKKVIVNGFTGNDASSASVVQLCPLNFGTDAAGKRRRNLITLLSMDMGRLGVSPWLYERQGAGKYNSSPTTPELPPTGESVSSIFVDGQGKNLSRTAAEAVLEKVDLNQDLRPYPHTAGNVDKTPVGSYHGRFDWDGPTLQAFSDAQSDRQNMAGQLFLRLLIVTGTPGPADPTKPTDDELVPLRWMAQLAANIVDFIDEDEISTPFNFYPIAFSYFAKRSPDPKEQQGFVGTVSDANANGDRLPRYWVFGTELPGVLLNEVFTQYELPVSDDKTSTKSGDFFVKVWAELQNPFPTAVPASVQQQDAQGVPLFIPKGAAGTSAYSSYQVVVANSASPGGPLRPRGDNVLGIADQVRSAATFDKGTVTTVDGTTVAMAVSPQQGKGFFLAGPLGNTRGNTIAAPRVPADVPWLQTNGMTWQVTYNKDADTWSLNDRSAGVTVLLRRLANPHLPPQDDPAQAFYNPYVTMDYIEQVPLNNVTAPFKDKDEAIARGKKQPYASDLATQIVDQVFSGDVNKHTLGQTNNPNGNRDWLVHMDRQVSSPYELLSVSGFRPHQLTQKFITKNGTHSQRVPWFDEDVQGASPPQSHRLYRLFAFMETPDQAAGVSARGRIPGKINLNTIWDYEVFAALCDAKKAADPTRSNSFTEEDVVMAWRALIARRNPDLILDPDATVANYTLGGLTDKDRPIYDPGVGFIPASDPAAPNGRGLGDTIFQPQDPSGVSSKRRLFQTDNAHPYLQNEMLIKIANGFTTRSNTFAVWLTTGFFEVVDSPTGQPWLGEEIGRSDGREIRYRFFAVVDRTQLVIAPGLTKGNPNGGQVSPSSQPQWMSVGAKQDPKQSLLGLNGWITYNGSATQIPWQIAAGSTIVIDRGQTTEEAVTVMAVDSSDPMNPRFQAVFRRDHYGNCPITMHGNPGPQPNWSPLSAGENLVVPYWEQLN